MGIFEKHKLDLLKKKIHIIIEKAQLDGRFSLFMSNFFQKIVNECNSYSGLKYYFIFVEQWDKECNIPLEIGKQIDKLTFENIVMIHRTRLSLDNKLDNEAIYNMMNEGLTNYGHANDAGVAIVNQGIPSLTLTSTPLNSLTGYINLLSSYRGSNAIILMSFPKEYLNEDGRVINTSIFDKIYYKNDGESYYKIKPEFMYGLLLKNESGKFDFYSKDQLLNNNGIKSK